MASASKPTAVHFWLIVFVILTLIMGVLWYVTYRDYTETAAQLQQSQQEASSNQKASRDYLEQIDRLKKVIGHEFENVGLDEEDNPNTVLGAMQQDMRQNGGTLAQPTFSATIVKLRQELNSTTKTNNSLQAKLNDQQQEILGLRNEYQAKVDQYEQAKNQAEATLRDRISNQEEALTSKDKMIDELRTSYSQLQVESEQAREAHATELNQKNQQLADLTRINDNLRHRLDEATKFSFEVPDGLIRMVDHVNNLVWINLGEADNLRPRTSFSVYGKSHHGVGRGPEEIKGAIEVTRVIGPHLAEARILKSDSYRPMTSGDPVYTPLWSPGQVERFSIVGLIDFDDNGISDRQQLHELIEAAGGTIDNEVDDQGNLTGKGITVATKFLVRGEIPDYTQSTPDKQDAHKKINTHFKEMYEQALQRGVRIVRLNDFLAYIGYKPSQRLWRPGESTRYTLKYGSRSTGVDQNATGRTSSGQVSELYGPSGRLKPPTSTGQTSGSAQRRGGY